MFKNVIIKKMGNRYRLISSNVRPLYHRFKHDFSYSSEEDKLKCNIIRAKSKLFEYCCCNYFYYFVTLTVNRVHDSQDLKWLTKVTTQIIRDCRKRYFGDFKFILIPELHKDGKSWHLHGLFDSSFGQDFYVNDYKYLSWSSYDKIGFSSISKIENYEATIKYITKYIKKGFENREKGKHLYFCSNGLQKSQVVNDLIFVESDLDIDYDVYTDYFCIKDMSEKEYMYWIDTMNNKVYQNVLNFAQNVSSTQK